MHFKFSFVVVSFLIAQWSTNSPMHAIEVHERSVPFFLRTAFRSQEIRRKEYFERQRKGVESALDRLRRRALERIQTAAKQLTIDIENQSHALHRNTERIVSNERKLPPFQDHRSILHQRFPLGGADVVAYIRRNLGAFNSSRFNETVTRSEQPESAPSASSEQLPTFCSEDVDNEFSDSTFLTDMNPTPNSCRPASGKSLQEIALKPGNQAAKTQHKPKRRRGGSGSRVWSRIAPQEVRELAGGSLMLPEWMLSVPSDLAGGWYFAARPSGVRCLVVSARGRTWAVSRAGKTLLQGSFLSALPGGGMMLSRRGGRPCWRSWPRGRKASQREYCVLDCILSPMHNNRSSGGWMTGQGRGKTSSGSHDTALRYNSGAENAGWKELLAPPPEFWVLDALCWGEVSLFGCSYEMRRFWLEEHLEQVPNVIQEPTQGKQGWNSAVASITQVKNEGLSAPRFRLVPSQTCSQEAIKEALECSEMQYEADGLLFYAREAQYVAGPSPVMLLWKDPSAQQLLSRCLVGDANDSKDPLSLFQVRNSIEDVKAANTFCNLRQAVLAVQDEHHVNADLASAQKTGCTKNTSMQQVVLTGDDPPLVLERIRIADSGHLIFASRSLLPHALVHPVLIPDTTFNERAEVSTDGPPKSDTPYKAKARTKFGSGDQGQKVTRREKLEPNFNISEDDQCPKNARRLFHCTYEKLDELRGRLEGLRLVQPVREGTHIADSWSKLVFAERALTGRSIQLDQLLGAMNAQSLGENDAEKVQEFHRLSPVESRPVMALGTGAAEMANAADSADSDFM